MAGLDLGDLVAYVDPEEDRLTLPVGGKRYTLPPVSAELAIWCKAMDAATRALQNAASDDERQAARERLQALSVPKFVGGRADITFEEVMLGGDVYARMVADGVPYRWIEICARTACLKIVYNGAAAQEFWEAGGEFPEGGGPTNRAERRAATRSTSTGVASETKPQVSTSGTSSRRRSGGRGRGSRRHGTRS